MGNILSISLFTVVWALCKEWRSKEFERIISHKFQQGFRKDPTNSSKVPQGSNKSQQGPARKPRTPARTSKGKRIPPRTSKETRIPADTQQGPAMTHRHQARTIQSFSGFMHHERDPCISCMSLHARGQSWQSLRCTTAQLLPPRAQTAR